MLDAEELYRRAQAAHRSGRHRTARVLFVRALARPADPDLHGRIELALAYVEAETGDAAGGLARCERALAIPGTTARTTGMIWSQLALLRARAGDVDHALQDFERAIGLLGDDEESLGRAYLNRGDLHLGLHRAPAAVADLERARDHLARAGVEVQSAKAEHNLGYARLLTGDLVGALSLMESAAEVLAPLSPVSRAVGAQDRAEVLLAAGRPREAAKALRAAASAYGAERLRRFQAECELVLARTLLVEDPAGARTVARRAARRFAAHGREVWALRAEALAVTGDVERGLRSAALLDRADALADRLRENGHREDADRLALHAARLAVRRGALADAAGRLGRVRATATSPVTTRLLAREVRAELAVARGRRGRARAHARQGLAELHAWQSSFGSLDLQSSLVGHGSHLARLGLGLAVADGRPELLLEWSERARALVGRVSPVRPPPDPVLAAELAALRSLGPDPGRRGRVLREQIRQHAWYAAGGGAVGEPATLEQVAAGVAEADSALVAYVVVAGRVDALVVTDAGARVVPLGRADDVRARLDALGADLDMAASRTSGALAAVIRSSLASALEEVAARLVAPLLPLLGERRVVLTPSGALAGTPWSLLPGFVGRPLTIAPSATRWLALRARPAPSGPARVGLVAGPRVARAHEEVRRAAAAWPDAVVLGGSDADAGRVADLAGRTDVLHLAGHGRHSGDNPLFSAVELADGPWFGHDVDALPRVPATVVLSACELGRVSVRSGEEAVGMSAAWLHAGARTVLSSPALVADDLACEALAAWHGLVAAGRTPGDALAEVGAGVPEEGAPLPFLCFGAAW